MDEEGRATEAGLDALRRRLYRPSATGEDVERYLAQRRLLLGEDELPAPGPPPAPPARRRSRTSGTAVGVVLVLAAAVTLTLLMPPDAIAPPVVRGASGTPAPTRVEDVGEGEVLRVVEGEVGPAARTTTTIQGVAVQGRRFSGRGSGVVDVPRPASRGGSGRMRVVVSAPGAVVRWRALVVVRGDDRTSYPLVVARGLADGPSSAGASGTFVFADRPPSRIAVAAAADVRWTLVVAISTGLG